MELNGKLYFSARDNTHGDELRCYDLATNTILLAGDINPGNGNSFIHDITLLNGKLYFGATANTQSYHLYSYDPQTLLTTMVSDVFNDAIPGAFGLVSFDNQLFFNAYDSAYDTRLWVYNPATDSTIIVTDSVEVRTWSDMIVLNDRLYFIADDGISGTELWSYDPINETIFLTADIRPGAIGSSPNYPVSYTHLRAHETS